MPDAPANVAEYCTLIVRSKLIPESQTHELRQRWVKEAGNKDDVEAFRLFLVRQKAITEYQSAILARGRADGFVIGGYTILDRLGKGASAGVYRARHNSGQVVALKVLPASRAKNTQILSRFQREGRLLTQLNHPNVVRAFQVSSFGGVHFIIMEHLDGETVEEVLARRKKLPPAEAVRIVYQALLGLQHLHSKKMIHRDLKPANLMVTPGPPTSGPDSTLGSTIKILDIGIGRELFTDDDPTTREIALTAEGAVLGTPDYLAPEQARDARSADIRADIYSLGCVLFQLISGRIPFTEKSAMAQMVKHATEQPPPLNRIVPGTPLVLQSVVERMMAKRPEERYPTPAEAAAALHRFLPEEAATPISTVVLPEYEEWLEADSPPTGPTSAVNVGAKPSGPISGSVPRPTSATKLTATRSPSSTKLPASPSSKKLTTGSGTSTPLPESQPDESTDPTEPASEAEEYEVELVSGPPVPPQIHVVYRGEDRPLVDLSRRDYIMLGIGAGGVLLAVGMGYGFARLLRPSSRPQEPQPASPEPTTAPSE